MKSLFSLFLRYISYARAMLQWTTGSSEKQNIKEKRKKEKGTIRCGVVVAGAIDRSPRPLFPSVCWPFLRFAQIVYRHLDDLLPYTLLQTISSTLRRRGEIKKPRRERRHRQNGRNEGGGPGDRRQGKLKKKKNHKHFSRFCFCCLPPDIISAYTYK